MEVTELNGLISQPGVMRDRRSFDFGCAFAQDDTDYGGRCKVRRGHLLTSIPIPADVRVNVFVLCGGTW